MQPAFDSIRHNYTFCSANTRMIIMPRTFP